MTEGDWWCHCLISSKNLANKDSNYFYFTRETCEIILIKFHFITRSKLWLYLVAGLHWSHFTEKQLSCWIALRVINHEVSESTEYRIGRLKMLIVLFADERGQVDVWIHFSQNSISELRDYSKYTFYCQSKAVSRSESSKNENLISPQTEAGKLSKLLFFWGVKLAIWWQGRKINFWLSPDAFL